MSIDGRSLHKWQGEALTAVGRILSLGNQDALIVGSVGSGKTWFALNFAKMLLKTGRISRIVIGVPSRRLIKQWAAVATDLGLNLHEVANNSALEKGLPDDAHGYIVTYHSIARWPDLHATCVHAVPTLVIFDEIHHLGDEDHTEWGPKCRVAFSSVFFRLALSGTPYRSSQRPIPFVRYRSSEGSNDERLLDADYTYSYGTAVADGVCRRIHFVPFDGPIEYKHNGKLYTHSFADVLPPPLTSARLNAASTAVNTEGTQNNLLAKMLHDANVRLTDLRNVGGHKAAGGFVIAHSVEQARSIAKLLQVLTGTKPIVVVNEDDRAQEQIEAFSNGESRWLVSVRMISEGVDIPRLRVLCYLSQITEELFFTQAWGRIVRLMKGILGESYVFFFQDARLVAHAKAVEAEILRAIKEKQEREPRDRSDLLNEPGLGVELIQADGDEQDNIVAGETFLPSDIQAAESLRTSHPKLAEFSILDLARFAADARGSAGRPKREMREPTYTQTRDALCGEIANFVGILNKITGEDFSHIQSRLNKKVGVSNRGQASVPQLNRTLALIKEEVMIARNGETY
jgi:superfamily II DNA or RNA helicase